MDRRHFRKPGLNALTGQLVSELEFIAIATASDRRRAEHAEFPAKRKTARHEGGPF